MWTRKVNPVTYYANEMVFDGFGSASFGRETINNISANRIKNDARLGGAVSA